MFRSQIDRQRSMTPRVTVLMPVYNAAAYVGAAIQSILAQEHDAFELLIVDDASTDGSLDVVRSFRDPRIHVLHNESNLKLAHALNRGLAEAKGDLIARMDAVVQQHGVQICHA